MSGLDIFAWNVLIVLAASAIGVFCIAGWLPGSAGTAAIFTDRVKAAHVIRKVLLRQIAIVNYVNPY